MTQEAFIKAYRALPAFRGDSAFYTWLYRIGINTAKNYLMAMGRRAPTSTEVDAGRGGVVRGRRAAARHQHARERAAVERDRGHREGDRGSARRAAHGDRAARDRIARGCAPGRPPRRSPPRVWARRTTCSRASRARTTARATAPCPAGRSPASRGGRADRETQDWHPQTRAVRGGLSRSGFDETAEALFLTSGFVYESAEQAEAAFKDEVEHYIYSRYGNPTVTTFEERMRLLEGAEACFATASGMAAVFTAMAALCGAGDRVVSLAGAVRLVLRHPRRDPAAVGRRDASSSTAPTSTSGARRSSVPTAAVFFETPSNPMQELVDIAAVSELAHAAGATVVVDNVFGTPVFSHPLEHGADVVVYSATKHIDGQGRALGGAVLGPRDFIDGPVKNLMRHTGPSMSPFNAWVMTKGLETLDLRVRAMADSSARRGRARSRSGSTRGRGIRRVRAPLPREPPPARARPAPDGRRAAARW